METDPQSLQPHHEGQPRDAAVPGENRASREDGLPAASKERLGYSVKHFPQFLTL